MAGSLVKVGLSAVVVLAVLFQVFLKDGVWLLFGIGRVMQPLSDFPYTCRKITDPRMEACEDMWLSEATRQLFLACSDPLARPHWTPNVGKLNVSGMSQRDAIVALDIDKPVNEGFEVRVLKTPDFSGTAGDGLLSLVGFTGIDTADGAVELLVINNRPSIDAETGAYQDQYAHGANTTIELFTTGPRAAELKHIRTHADKEIATPNRVAAIDSKTFYFTNDRGPHKVGLRSQLSAITGEANVHLCEADRGCRQVADGLKFANGLARDKDGLIYVPDSISGHLHIYRILDSKDLEKVDEMDLGYSLDNASVDKNGDVWIAAFPVGLGILQAYNDPYNAHPAAAVLRVTKVEGKYVVDKVIEDGQGDVLPATTTVVHDAKTGRLFFSSVISPFIAVCEPKA
ncbi:hypothetical protein F66182_8506 [Fusarium sp. NRRL 66182]|nr:hypothetical protein F66182_8506 [Fusarium sp. NRRL 66182]